MTNRPCFAQLWLALAALMFCAHSAVASPGRALLRVTKIADTNDGSCDAGDCSLREAINAANAGDIVAFSSLFSTPQTITLTGGELFIDTSLTLEGTGARLLTISGGGASRVFRVAAGQTVEIARVHVAMGSVTNANGAGIDSAADSLFLNTCIVSGNHALGSGVGGGIAHSGGSLTIINSTIRGNSAQDGGGIRVLSGSVQLRHSTLAANVARHDGGGLHLRSAQNTVFASTLSGNSAVDGGGIAFAASGGSALLQIVNGTLADNHGLTGFGVGGITVMGDGAGGSATLSLRSTILAHNDPVNLGRVLLNGGTATIISEGFNLSTEDSSLDLDQTSDKNNADPVLGSLADNGGLTQTQALYLGSAALDAAISDGAGMDQRGEPTPTDLALPDASGGDGADIGAYEAQVLPPPIAIFQNQFE